jgi:hypothetical protein
MELGLQRKERRTIPLRSKSLMQRRTILHQGLRRRSLPCKGEESQRRQGEKRRSYHVKTEKKQKKKKLKGR